MARAHLHRDSADLREVPLKLQGCNSQGQNVLFEASEQPSSYLDP
nr:hypothetical protein Iba_chr14cCG12620 [Ipomoea batatas]